MIQGGFINRDIISLQFMNHFCNLLGYFLLN